MLEKIARNWEDLSLPGQPASRTILGAAIVAGLSGCVGEDVSAGAVGNTVNAGRCHAANCDFRPTTTRLTVPVHGRCSILSAVSIVEELRVEAVEGGLRELALAPDGTLWTLHEDWSTSETWVEHHAPDGTLLGASEHTTVPGTVEQHLAADAESRGWVSRYVRSAGVSADEVFAETSTLRGYEADGAPASPPYRFAYVAGAMLARGPNATLTLAGSATQNDQGGSILRLDEACEPEWIQTLVTTDGLGLGLGVVGLAVHGDGGSALLSERGRDITRDQSSFGVARYRTDGLLTSDTVLAQLFTGGYRPALADDGGGNLVVLGPSGFNGTASLEVAVGIPAGQGNGWAWELEGFTPALAVDPALGTAFVAASTGLAIIPGDGTTCTLAAGMPTEFPSELEYGGAGTLYYGEPWGFGRVKLVGYP